MNHYHWISRLGYPSNWSIYRFGFQSEIDGVDVGEDLDIGNLGFTLYYQVNDNFGIRGGYASNVFGNSDIDNGVFRIQFMYGWNRVVENAKKLQGGEG